MMRFPRNLPINRKVTLVVLVTATACLILACLALFAFQLLSFRRNFINDLSALTDVVANSSVASVAFDDRNAAVDILTGLKARPHVRSATIVKDGEIFAQFGEADTLAALARYPKETGYLFDEGKSLLHSKPIMFEDEPIGMLYVRSDYRSVYLSLFRLYSGILAGVLAVSVGVAWVISMRLQRFVSDPILQLAETARSIAESRDYSVRVPELKQDEVGILKEAFNQMLSQIEARDSVLQSTQETLKIEVGERRRTEEVLRESEERFRAFMDNSPAIAFIKDRMGRYVYLNKPFEKHFGMELSNWAGKTDFEAWPFELAELMRANETMVLENDEPRQFVETIPVQGGGSEDWLILKFTLRDRTGEKFIGGVGVDVTERNRLEAELRQSQKLEAIGQLAGGVAHDFNNILAVIIGYSEAGLDRTESGSGLRQSLSEIVTAANRGTDLIKQLLAFSRKEVTWPRVVDLNSALIEIDKILHRLVGEDICLTLLLGQDTGSVKIDPGQIEQVVINLVVNARDAMPNGGQLLVETHKTLVGPIESEQHDVAPGEYLTVEVSDTGTGMSAETQARIFEPFFTTKESGRGTGLGLSTCYGIAKQNRGFMTVESTLGMGSTFRVYFPRVQAVAETARVPEPDELPEGEESVLVVEDDEPLREVTAEALRGLGYDVVEAADGEYARQLLDAENTPRIDLVLTDLGMPRMDGASLAKWVATEKPHVKVLLISGYGTNPRLKSPDHGGDYKFLPKPFTRKQLAISVREVLDDNAVLAR